MIRNAPRGAAVYGVDLGKNLFHVVGLDDRGAVVQRVKFRRDTLLAFFERAARAVVGMEACPGSQWLARKLLAMGHQVRIIPAQFVKPCVKSQKNDTIDAEAIAEAVTRPTMRFTQVRTAEQIDLQALHRIRDQQIASRTRLINQMRAFCLEYGVAIRQGAASICPACSPMKRTTLHRRCGGCSASSSKTPGVSISGSPPLRARSRAWPRATIAPAA